MNKKTLQRMSIAAHVMCGWPLILVFFGGAIGGAMGGLAYVINVAIYKAGMPTILKIVLNILVGTAALVLWLVIAAAIHQSR